MFVVEGEVRWSKLRFSCETKRLGVDPRGQPLMFVVEGEVRWSKLRFSCETKRLGYCTLCDELRIS